MKNYITKILGVFKPSTGDRSRRADLIMAEVVRQKSITTDRIIEVNKKIERNSQTYFIAKAVGAIK